MFLQPSVVTLNYVFRFSILLAAGFLSNAQPVAQFITQPYLQLGARESQLTVMWHTREPQPDWVLEYRQSDGAWKSAAPKLLHTIPKSRLHVYSATMDALAAATSVIYRIRAGAATIFEADALAPAGPGQPFRFMFVGDGGDGGGAERRVAYQAAQVHAKAPLSFALLGGDIAYVCGGVNDYLENVYPAYNAATAGPGTGAPLMRSMVFAAAIGNHDAGLVDILCMRSPDLAYYYFWSHPANGPAQVIAPPKKQWRKPSGKFPDTAKALYPARSNYSFNWGGAHFTVLDSNEYVDWTAAPMQAWLEQDLVSAAGAAWRFVVFHHAPFQTSAKHQSDQWMRVLAPLFEKYNVGAVLNGHVHNYQRSKPILFAAADSKPGPAGLVPGTCTVDDSRGVVYLVSGGGGHLLVNGRDKGDSCTTNAAFYGGESFTVAAVSKSKVSFQQIDGKGDVVDSWELKR